MSYNDRVYREKEIQARHKPRVGQTVAVFLDGSTHPSKLRSGVIINVGADGWTIDVDLNSRPNEPNATIVGCQFAPHRALVDGEQRPAKSWDFIV